MANHYRAARPGWPLKSIPSVSAPGFTLIELLVVIVVIGILAAIGSAGYVDMRERAHATTLQADMATIVRQQELFYHANGRYAAIAELTDFRPSKGTSLELPWLAPSGFALTANHSALPGYVCGFYMGEAPGGSAGPANVMGQVKCE